MKGLVLAGTASGVGKTVATLAAIRALETAGHTVQPAKAGPDFIDPSHHAALTGTPSRTLDAWLEGEDGLRRNYVRGTGDVCVVEGVMGLYDGDGSSTAQVAALLDLPIILVVDASAGMQSVAATALGFQRYADHVDLDLDLAGIIAQCAHGGRHEAGIRDALPASITYFGRIPPNDELAIPDRHLGLHMGDEAPLSTDALDEAATHLDAETLSDIARTPPNPGPEPEVSKTDARIAIARDDAFRFVYPAVTERLSDRADLVSFAPTAGDDLPDCDGLYLPGGYPELHAEALSNSPTLDTIHDRATAGLPILGECGGLMALAESLSTTDGHTYDMAGVLPAEVQMHDRYQALDHVELNATTDTVTARSDTTIRGHEFHYSSAALDPDARFAFEMVRGDGLDGNHDGLTEYQTLGTYSHVHAESGAFDTFLDHCQP